MAAAGRRRAGEREQGWVSRQREVGHAIFRYLKIDLFYMVPRNRSATNLCLRTTLDRLR